MNAIINELLESQRIVGELTGVLMGVSHYLPGEVKPGVKEITDKAQEFQFSNAFWLEIKKLLDYEADND